MSLDFSQLVLETIKNHGVASVIGGGLLEQIIVPVPSPIIPMAAGFFFVAKDIAGFWVILKELFLKAALPFAIGSTIGSTMVYLIAWFGGRWMIERFKKWLEIDWGDIEAIKRKYFKGTIVDELVIFLSRAIPIVPSVLFSAACGAIRISPGRFYVFTALGLLVRGMLLGWLGWQSGEALLGVSKGLDRWEMILTIGMVALGFTILAFGYRQRKKWLTSLRQ